MFSYSRIAFLLSFLSVAFTAWVSKDVYENIPHVEDEFAFLWQAQVFSRGQVYLPSPPHQDQLVVPFVVDYKGLRFGKYPPGWPLLLSLSVSLRIVSWINPILAGSAVWFIFRLGQKIFNDRVALLAAGLLFTSPFFLINSGTLMSHPWSLMLSLALTLGWLDLFMADDIQTRSVDIPNWIRVWTVGLSLGLLVLTRPITAAGVGFPFFIHGLAILRKGDAVSRKYILMIGTVAGGVASMLFAWQYILTGDPMQNLYPLWWSYDRMGFGKDVGTQTGGHNLFWIINNLVLSLLSGSEDLFGAGIPSLLFIPFGLWSARRRRPVELLVGVPIGLAVAYAFYWISPNLYGPRYYYETIISAVLLTSAGIFWLIDKGREVSVSRLLSAAFPLLVIVLVAHNLTVYLPARLDSMRNLYGINRDQLTPFLSEKIRGFTPALVIVHGRVWMDCAGLLSLQDPWLTTPFIFACYTGEPMQMIDQRDFPDRRIIHYFPATREFLLDSNE